MTSFRGPRTTGIAASPDQTIAIALEDVSKTFPGSDVAAVDRLSLEIPRGELVVFVGPSGCGKTTTLRLINRLEAPTTGRITIDGADVGDTPPDVLRRGMGYVIQNVGLFPHRTIEANIATVPKLLGWPKAKIRARVRELVDLVDLDPALLKRYPAALSGGQQQRVGVARALAVDPPILLMDEPYSAVDPVVRAHLQDELVSLHQRLGTTIVVVTHDIDEAIRIADRIAVFAIGGRLAQYATPDELLRVPADDFVESFLGGDRALRRLGLIPLKNVERQAVHGAGTGRPQLDLGHTARDALDALLASGADSVIVCDDGMVVGEITMAELTAAIL